MTVDDTLQTLLNKRLLAAARQPDGNIEELLTSEEFREPEDPDSFVFNINCIDLLGNTPLHLAVLSASEENVNHLIESDGCDVDLQNSAGDTPLHLAVQIQDQDARHAIVRALVETAGALDSIRLTNKAGQTPKALAEIYFPRDEVVITLTTPPARRLDAILDKNDIASDGEGGSGSDGN